MEIRFSNSSSEGVEVCVGDHWLVAAISAMTANGSRAAQNISIRVASLESTSAVLTWSPEVAGISRYDVSCQETTQGLNYRVKIVDASTAMIQINGLTPGTTYECCVTAHSNTHLPLDLKYSSCHTIRTLKSGSLCYSSGIIAVSISLSLSTLILLGVCVAMGIKIKLLIEGAKAKVPGA